MRKKHVNIFGGLTVIIFLFTHCATTQEALVSNKGPIANFKISKLDVTQQPQRFLEGMSIGGSGLRESTEILSPKSDYVFVIMHFQFEVKDKNIQTMRYNRDIALIDPQGNTAEMYVRWSITREQFAWASATSGPQKFLNPGVNQETVLFHVTSNNVYQSKIRFFDKVIGSLADLASATR